MEALDRSFENVCELDLIFHSDKVNYILDEIIMAGMVLETNIGNILTAVKDQSKMHDGSLTMNQSSVSVGTVLSNSRDATSTIFSTLASSIARK